MSEEDIGESKKLTEEQKRLLLDALPTSRHFRLDPGGGYVKVVEVS